MLKTAVIDRCYRKIFSGPAQVRLVDRPLPDALARGGEDGVADGRWHHRVGRFAQAGRRVGALDEMNSDPRRRGVDAEQREVVEVALHGPALLEGHFLQPDGAQPVVDRTLDLV